VAPAAIACRKASACRPVAAHRYAGSNASAPDRPVYTTRIACIRSTRSAMRAVISKRRAGSSAMYAYSAGAAHASPPRSAGR
jgi:hypothetical protein